MGKIVVLDDNMINMIAAGEVIERPASVVKELLENSIDSGAGKIVVTIEDGGRKLISVVDDGCGMDGGDLCVAFEPHATSKIKTSDDLMNISTMGFRGEALASIAAVSRVSVVSRTADSIEGNRIEIDCGRREEVSPCSSDCGTAVEVRNIFYKLPGRRKFLRTANTEMTHISEHFTRIALANCDLDMTLIHNGRQLHRLMGGQSLRERIGQLFSKDLAGDLIETQSREKGMRIHVLLGTPNGTRGSNKFQYAFLNGRFIRDKFVGHALKEAYRGLIDPTKYPVVFIFMELSPEAFDVNVHPTKIEVRFENANLVHSQVLAVMREKLLSSDQHVGARLPSPSASLAEDGLIGTEDAARRERIADAMARFFSEHKPGSGPQQQFKFSGSGRGGGYSAGKDFGSGSVAHSGEQGGVASQGFDDGGMDVSARLIQLHDSYIVAQTEDGFVIIDQHALHERVIYEDLCRKISDGNLPSQRLLIPETFEVTDAENDAVKSNQDLLDKLGIELEPFGPKTVAIQSFPILPGRIGVLEFVRDLLDVLCDKSFALDAERLLHEVLDMAACKAAIKAGQSLSASEMQQLLADREAVQRAGRCPHGRPTTIKFTIAELEKQFKRT